MKERTKGNIFKKVAGHEDKSRSKENRTDLREICFIILQMVILFLLILNNLSALFLVYFKKCYHPFSQSYFECFILNSKLVNITNMIVTWIELCLKDSARSKIQF